MTAQQGSCCPPRYLNLPSGVSTHTQKNAALANAIPESDPEPKPSDGPDYHTEYAFWLARQKERGNA